MAVALVPLVIFGYSSYTKSSSIVDSQFGDYGQYAVNQLKWEIDSNLEQMDSIAKDILAYLFPYTT